MSLDPYQALTSAYKTKGKRRRLALVRDEARLGQDGRQELECVLMHGVWRMLALGVSLEKLY